MESEKLIYLIKRHARNLNTPEEERELLQFIRNTNDVSEILRGMEEVWDEQEDHLVMDEAVSKRILANVMADKPRHHPKKISVWIGWAAAVLIIGLAGLFYWPDASEKQKAEHTPEAVLTKTIASIEHKMVTLPDGSTVILNENSTLEYPDHFNGKTREVTLIGEGYFDIKRNPDQQFIVHTGKLQTVVLGTAFNIRALNDNQQVTVTVTRGKVSVEKDRKVLGVLTPNQQIVFQEGRQPAEPVKVKAKEVVAWQEHDLFFEDVTMEEAARVLSKRFNVTIGFKDDAGKQCRFSAVFLKRQELTEILDVITAFNNASYTSASGVITITGKDCNAK